MRRIIGAALRAKQKWLEVDCLCCGRPTPSIVCLDCIAASGSTSVFRRLPYDVTHPFKSGFYLGRYATGDSPTAIARALLRFKYNGDRACGHFLKRLFRDAAPTITGPFDLVVPVPLHRQRLRERGYNQAAWLARAGAKGLRVSLQARALLRVRDTPPQAQARGHERRGNLSDAFTAQSRLVYGRCVLLVDDVYTTGTTAAEAARTLASAGASDVSVAVLLAALRDE
jgi:ComF family protein